MYLCSTENFNYLNMKSENVYYKIRKLEAQQRKILKNNNLQNEDVLRFENKRAWVQYEAINLEKQKLKALFTELAELEKEIKKSNKGGKREGSGRKSKTGSYTRTMRVPAHLIEEISTYLKLRSLILNESDVEILEKEDIHRMQMLAWDLEWMAESFKNILNKQRIEEEDKRQLDLFDKQNKDNIDKDE